MIRAAVDFLAWQMKSIGEKREGDFELLKSKRTTMRSLTGQKAFYFDVFLDDETVAKALTHGTWLEQTRSVLSPLCQGREAEDSVGGSYHWQRSYPSGKGGRPT